jgi:ABC-2 type transport system permease protein
MNSIALKSIVRNPVEESSFRRIVGAYLTETRYEFTRTRRNVPLILPMILVPMALYAFFVVAISGVAIANKPSLGIYLFGAFSVMSVSMPALFGIGTSLAVEREMGLMLLKRAQPAPTGSWLVAKIVVGIVFSAVAYLPMLALALGTGRLTLEPGQIVAMSAAMIAGSIPFCALGLMVGTLFKGSAAAGYANLIFLPGCYLSGLFFPLPDSMKWQAPLWPQFHIQQLAMRGADATEFQFVPVQLVIGCMVAFTVTFSAVAIWRLARKG